MCLNCQIVHGKKIERTVIQDAGSYHFNKNEIYNFFRLCVVWKHTMVNFSFQS